MNSSSMMAAQALFVTVLVIFGTGTVLSKIAGRIHVPDVVLFLLGGMVLGPSVLGWVRIAQSSTLDQVIVLFGASLILLHGGTITTFVNLRKVWLTVSLLSTVGVVITAGVVALAAHWIAGLPYAISFLLGALLASTDPAALIPIFQRLPIRQRVVDTVISESAFTDATGAILTILVLTVIDAHGGISAGVAIVGFLRLAIGGILVGSVVGIVAAFLIAEHDKAMFREYTPMILAMAVLAGYAIAQWLGASGFMSVFVTGLMIGNAKSLRLPIHAREQQAIHDFIDPLELKLRMLIFVLLGSQVNVARLLPDLVPAVLVVLVFMFVARPLTVLGCVLPDRRARFTASEVLFFFWVRETGVIAAALVGILAGDHILDSDVLVSITFVAILMTLLIQASTTPFVAKTLRLESEPVEQSVDP
ncbi:MAG: cation:proton antiporter [Firmicutes bacterium]|nr:cation:proton antiporter [Bacillota bacterium]